MNWWAIGVYDYRLTSDQFWRLTPAQFFALSKRYDAEQEKRDMSAAIVSYSVFKAAGAKKVKVEDFMPRYRRSKKVDGERFKAQLLHEIVPRVNSCFPDEA